MESGKEAAGLAIGTTAGAAAAAGTTGGAAAGAAHAVGIEGTAGIAVCVGMCPSANSGAEVTWAGE